MPARAGRALMTIWAYLAGCGGPELDLPPPRAEVSTGPALELEPPAEPSAVTSVFRGRLRGAAALGQPWLLQGALSDYHERALAQGQLPEAIRTRALPLRYWRDERDWLLQPLTPLEPDARYSLALLGHGLVEELVVAAGSASPPARLFPPPERPKHAYALYCGLELPSAAPALSLEPGHVPLELSVGAAGTALAGCVELRAQAELVAPLVGPPTLGGAPFEPSPFVPSRPSEAVDCGGEQLLAGGCLHVLDDRVQVTQGSADMLWLLSDPAPQLIVARAGQRFTLLQGLTADTAFELLGETVSSQGEVSPLRLRVTTGAERRHLVLSEVLANALGPEPASEWVELINDAERPVVLDGLWLEDATGRAALPAATLAGGEIVVLVTQGAARSALDVPFAAGARVLELPTLGERGLANSGEPLLLVGPEGIISRFPAFSAPHAGRSFARRSPDAPDDRSSSFAEHGGSGASPGAINSFD
ncbi:MAG TPA: lamin tail domain-containing protein [Polyangiaceae bacterium]